MIYNASAQRMKREDERNQADGGAQARQADIAFPAQPLPAADKPAQPAQTAAERSAAPAGLFSPAPAAPDNKQKKAASLIGDLSHPDFMKPIRETAGAAAGKKPAAAYVGYDFTKMLQEALDALGADLAVDGVFGPKTQAAYDGFQRRQAKRAEGPRPSRSGAKRRSANRPEHPDKAERHSGADQKAERGGCAGLRLVAPGLHERHPKERGPGREDRRKKRRLLLYAHAAKRAEHGGLSLCDEGAAEGRRRVRPEDAGRLRGIC